MDEAEKAVFNVTERRLRHEVKPNSPRPERVL